MQDLYRFAGSGVVYLARVDTIRPVYKYGISRDIYKRIISSHQKTFPIFDLQHVAPTNNREIVEKFLTLELKYRKIHHKEKYSGKMQRELILLKNSDHIDEIKNLIDRIIIFTNQNNFQFLDIEDTEY